MSRKSQQGYSLTELSVVMLIVGSIAGLSLSMGTTQYEAMQISSTQSNLELVRKAMVLYEKKTGVYPCPADGSLATTDANYGVALAACSAADCGGLPAGGAACIGANGVIGTIPFKTLGINDDVALDKWDSRISYILDESHSVSSAYNNGDLMIEDENGNTISNHPDFGGAIFVLLSHGPNRSGAWPKNGGTRLACTAGMVETPNCDDGDDTFIDQRANYSEVVANYYDDLVTWQSQTEVDLP